jgi:arabinan endo-1,5-alpha-L-arabinosidase
MNKLTLLLLALLPLPTLHAQETAITQQEARTLYKTTTKKRVSVHDPSVVYDPNSGRYYIFGSHRACAWTSDMQNWTHFSSPWKVGGNNNASNDQAFVTPAVTKVPKGGEMVDFPSFNALEWAARTDASYNVNGNMWAPDVLWNPTMQKWCQYLSVNGDRWHSSIILLTSNNVEGPYLYQGPVVISGFYDSQHTWKDTDLELVIGAQNTLPSRYNTGNGWGNRYPNNIDPCVFFDEDGLLWMAYGSWSGGIWMLRLNAENGLRDYDVTYNLVGSGDDITTDPYFGKKIAGGHYVSGEGAYIEHIGEYYYLFMSYGGLDQKGGYEMRVFRSKKPDGPYLDPGNRNAIFTSYSLNFGPKAPARGQKLLGPYSHWGFMPQGERSQGHNSIIAAPDGRTYLVYHTRFCNDEQRPDEGHQVRVHQVLLSKNGWLLAAPFEYNGESITDADIATQQLLTSEQVAGTYEVLLHKFANDHQNLEQVTPIVITLDADGKVSGDKTGTWSLEAGTGYINLTLSALKYEGVVLEETMDEQNLHAVAITATNTQGVGLWAYKKHPKYAVAWQLNHQTVPVKDGQTVNHNVDLYSILVDGEPNVSAEWVSSHPDIISNTGRYNPAGLQENTNVTLTARIASANYYWQQDYTVRALSEQNSQPLVDGWQEGIVAHYGFDDGSLANTFNADEMAQFLRKGATKAPSLYDDDPLRNGGYVRLSAGANKKESYVAIPNPLYGKELADGATLAFWVRRTDANLWDALCGFEGGDAHLYTTGNLYTGYNDGHGNWIDINHPETVATTNLTVGHWHQLTIIYSRQASRGITMYVDGVAHSNDRINGEQGGKKVSTKSAFDYNAIVDLIASSPMLYLGNGSFWGSPDASFDDVIVYDRAFTRSTEATALYQMMDRVFSFSSLTNGIGATLMNNDQIIKDVYDLQGRKVLPTALKKGIYIINGKKTVKL